MNIAPCVLFKDGSAYLKISPTTQAPAEANAFEGCSTNAQDVSPSTVTSTPWPASATRSDQEILKCINNGAAKAHPSRLPMTLDVLRLMLNNIQGQFNLQVGTAGAWNSLADARLLELLEKPKKKKKRGGKALAIEDTDTEQAPQLAMADAPFAMDAKDTAPQEEIGSRGRELLLIVEQVVYCIVTDRDQPQSDREGAATLTCSASGTSSERRRKLCSVELHEHGGMSRSTRPPLIRRLFSPLSCLTQMPRPRRMSAGNNGQA